MNDVHDAYDPNSPAADLQLGSEETVEMLSPLTIIVADRADLPDDPDQLSLIEPDTTTAVGLGIQEMVAHSADGDHCSDPVADERADDARNAGFTG